MQGRELRRFPKGQTCSECPARRYYLESGFRYCQNGHRVEGFIEYDVDLEGDNYGQQGAISRKAKQKRERQHKHLSGNTAAELCLECLQLILRKQVAWLVRERDLPAELETVVRDLWDLRVRNFGGLRIVDGKERRKGRGRDTNSETASGSESERFYSSQGETDGESDAWAGRSVRASRIKTWAVREGQRWPMPTLMDTLALCYVGCLAMRLPVRIGDLFGWARSGSLLFIRAITEVPRKMSDRLPAQYQKMLRGRYSSLRGGELHAAVADLIKGYQKNYDMVFPPLNTPLLLLRYLRELGLPLEVYVYAEKLVSLLRLEFSYSTTASPPFSNPDSLLAMSLVLAVKILYPFASREQESATVGEQPSHGGRHLDWAAWAAIYQSQYSRRKPVPDYDKTTSAEVYDMTSEDMDSYLDWYEETQITVEQDTRDIERLFPLHRPAPSATPEDDREEDETTIEARIEEVRKHISWVKLGTGNNTSDHDAKMARLGKQHQRYQTVDDLSGPARVFHERVAQSSGLSEEELVKGVFRLEQKLLYWQQVVKDGADIDMDEMEGIERAPSGRAAARLLGVKNN